MYRTADKLSMARHQVACNVLLPFFCSPLLVNSALCRNRTHELTTTQWSCSPWRGSGEHMSSPRPVGLGEGLVNVNYFLSTADNTRVLPLVSPDTLCSVLLCVIFVAIVNSWQPFGKLNNGYIPLLFNEVNEVHLLSLIVVCSLNYS